MKKQPPPLAEILAKSRRDYRLTRSPDGAFTVEADGEEDHARAMDAVERIGKLSVAFPAVPPSPASKLPAMTIGKAVRLFLTEVKAKTKRKTFIIKQASLDGFAKHYGENKQLAEAERLEVGSWVMALRASGLETPTIANKLTYLRGFFVWAKARGFYPPFVKGDGPADGQVIYRAKEKRDRRGFGWKPFTSKQIQTLYDPVNFRKLSPSAKWGALIGLYTGARVSEVGQLAIGNFIEKDKIPCFVFTEEGEHQSLKTEPSERTVPLHPDLIKLGLLAKVEELRKAGKTRFFDNAKEDAINGQGNWLSKAFSYYWKKHLPPPPKGILGFHSLRKTLVQSLQDLRITAEVRVNIVGHELKDEHFNAYSRKSTPTELLQAIKPLNFQLDLVALKKLLI